MGRAEGTYGNGQPVDWVALRVTLHNRWKKVRQHQMVEDAIQDALVIMLLTLAFGREVNNPIAFANRLVHRRIVDEWRRRRPRAASEALADIPCEEASTPARWNWRLECAGHRPTTAWISILAAIEAGVRTNKGLARILGKDPTTVKESRARLQRWLSRIADEWRPPPPHDQGEEKGRSG